MVQVLVHAGGERNLRYDVCIALDCQSLHEVSSIPILLCHMLQMPIQLVAVGNAKTLVLVHVHVVVVGVALEDLALGDLLNY